MEKNYDYTEIEKYVKEELDGTELSSFEHKISKDNTLKEEVNYYKQIAELATLKGLFEEAASELTNEEKGEKEEVITQKKEVKIFSLSRRVLSLAASFLVIVSAGWWVFSTGTNTLPGEYSELINNNFVHYPAQTSRGEETNPSLYDAYKNKNYKTAASTLEQYAITKKDATAQLYAAISYIALDQPQKAIELLSGVEGVESLNNRKYYYLGLAQLQLGQTDKAINAFKQVNEIDAFLYKKVIVILETLNK